MVTQVFENPIEDSGDKEANKLAASGRSISADLAAAQVDYEAAELKRRSRLLHDKQDEFYCDGSALGFLALDSGLRINIFKFVHGPVFNAFILIIILVNVGILVVQSPGNDLGDDFNNIAETLDLLFTCVFTVEAILRILALGFVSGWSTYLRNPWCCLDFVVVVSAWASEIFVDKNAPKPNVFRCLRAVRPLRSLRFFTGLKAILASLFNASILLVEVLGFLLFFFCLFGAIGINLFQGALTHECAPFPLTEYDTSNPVFPMAYYTAWQVAYQEQNGRILGFEECPLFTTNCPLRDYAKDTNNGALMMSCCQVVNEKGYGDRRDEISIYGFNNISTTFMSEFVATTMDDWPGLSGPLRESNISTAWLVWPYFALATLVLAILTGNLFVSVICYAFGQLELEEGNKELALQAVRKLRVMFDRFDADGSGQITGAELGGIALALGITWSERDITMAMSQMDTDSTTGSGQEAEVDFEEFADWWKSENSQAVRLKRAFSAEEHRLKTVFLEVDVDRGGSLDKEEVRAMVQKVGLDLVDEELDAAMADMDPSGDGEVDFFEFTAWWFGGSELSIKVKSASNTEDGAIRRIFDDLCVDGQVEINFEKLDGLGATLGVTLSKPEVLQSLQEMDEDGGGSVDFEEFSHWWKSESKTAQKLRVKLQRQEAQVRVLFERLDEDHGGDIGRGEMETIAKKIGMDMSEEDMGAMMKEIDASGNDSVDYGEFMIWWTSSSDIAARFKYKLTPYLKKEADPKFPFIPGCGRCLDFHPLILSMLAVHSGCRCTDA